ncbi:MAG: hypothetical protein H6746_01650 [Deltaproteobacteria bacterium]|nr:hypothetical protein [Deltaproteobacteria bacterium]
MPGGHGRGAGGALPVQPPPLEATVDLPDYCIDRAEVSAAEFLDCVADGGCTG